MNDKIVVCTQCHEISIGDEIEMNDPLIMQNSSMESLMELRDSIEKLFLQNHLLLEFVRRVKSSSCNEIPEMCLACDALELLRKLGKEE